MSNALSLGLVTLDIAWENPHENRSKISKLLKSQPDANWDIVILPEMFTTGFSMNPEKIAEPYQGKTSETIVWKAELAARHQTCITGSIAFKEGDQFYNRLIWMPPDGNFSVYDKKHLFSFADEDQHYAAGDARLIVEYKGWKICPLVCYDLRFPIWSRNTKMAGNTAYDLLIYVANWPSPRFNAWEALLRARAIENLSYTAGINRIGKDENGLDYLGGGLLFDYKGKELSRSSEVEDSIETQIIYKKDLDEFRGKFPALTDSDPFVLV